MHTATSDPPEGDFPVNRLEADLGKGDLFLSLPLLLFLLLLIWLVKYLAEKYDIDYLIGHYEYTNFEGHPLWLEVDESYRTKKTDPGEDFMAEVRAATKKFNFKPVPNK